MALFGVFAAPAFNVNFKLFPQVAQAKLIHGKRSVWGDAGEISIARSSPMSFLQTADRYNWQEKYEVAIIETNREQLMPRMPRLHD